MDSRGRKMTIAQLAQRLGVTYDQVYDWCKSAGLPHVQVKVPRRPGQRGGGVFVFERDYEAWVAERRMVCVDGVCRVA